MGNFVRHTSCPNCGSKDNLAMYDDGSYYCFSGCGYTKVSDDFRLNSNKGSSKVKEKGLTEKIEKVVSTKPAITQDEVKEIKGFTSIDPKNFRGIRKDITQQFGVRNAYDEEGNLIERYYPCTQEGQLVGYKIREVPKNFRSIGRTGADTELFMQFKFNRGGKYILVCEGEEDSLAAYQILIDYNKSRGSEFETAVVSPTTGAKSIKQIANNYQFFDSFDNIILSFDNDKAGQEAVQEVVKHLPKGKVKIMQNRHKDANEYLEKGDEKSFIRDFYAAKTYVPVGVVGSNEISDAMREELDVPKIPLPAFMHQLQKMMAGGIPLGRIVNLGSASGTGKSTIVDELIYFWLFSSPHKCGIVTLESTVGQYGIKLLSRHLSKKLELLEREVAISFVNEEETKRKEHELFNDEEGNPRFYLADDRDGSVENIQDVIENLIISCNCKVIVCDPLHDIISMLPLEEQEKFMSWQKGMVKSHNVTFINVCHTRKTGNGQKAGSTGADLHEEDLMGNSSIYKSAACNLMFTRNKEAENEIERNVTIMKATKIRWTGNTGVAGKYYYDNQTHTLYDLDDWLNATGYTGLGEF